MSPAFLPDHIGPLVDRLRSGEHQNVSLPDVAALTEILMRSLESYFKSIDLTIYEECQSLADYIDDARKEISSLSPEHSDSVGIPRAGLELEAIVQQTESATNTIMESAEKIMEADSSDMEAYTSTVNDAVMQIFEACSFQDITGQRISKVVDTLAHVEDRVSRLVNILGVMENGAEAAPEEEIDENKALLNGPALEGEGIDQAEIDTLLNEKADSVENNNDDDFEFVEEAPEAEAASRETRTAVPQAAVEEDVSEPEKPTEEAEPNLIEQAKLKKAQAQAEKQAQVKPPKPVVYEEDPQAGLSPKPSEKTTQSDIDALFS